MSRLVDRVTRHISSFHWHVAVSPAIWVQRVNNLNIQCIDGAKNDCNVRVGRNFRTRKSCKDGDSKVTVPADVLTRNVPVQSRNFFYGVAGDECRR